MISGLVFEQDDFIRPWDGREDNLERWEPFFLILLIAIATSLSLWSFMFSCDLIDLIVFFLKLQASVKSEC